MQPLMQTKFGHDPKDADTCGDCMAACIASILELDLDAVPNFALAGDSWMEALQVWLSDRGLAYVEIRLKEGSTAELDLPAGIYYIMVGKSPRGDFLHAVIYHDYKLAHDPHPSQDGIETFNILGFIVPRNPKIL